MKLTYWLRELITIAPTSSRWSGTLRRGAGIILPMLVTFWLVSPEAGLISMVGSMTPVAVSNGMPFKSRVKSLLTISIAIALCMGIGAMSNAISYAIVAVVFVVGALAMFVYHSIFSGPPGPIGLIFATVLGSYICGTSGYDPILAVLITLFGALGASAISLLDVLIDPVRPVRSAVSDAVSSVDSFQQLIAEKDIKLAQFSEAKNNATRRINRAWNYLDAGVVLARPAILEEIAQLKSDLVKAHMQFAGMLEEEETGEPRFHADDVVVGQISLPGFGYRIRTNFNTRSHAFFAAMRLGIACSAAAFITYGLHIGHPYWAVLTAGMMLHLVPDRVTSIKKAGFRAVGETAGLLLYALIIPFLTSGTQAFVVVLVLFLLHDYVNSRNMALGAMMMTPLALLVATVGNFGHESALMVIATRAFETVVGMVCALVSLYFVGRSAPERMIRTQFRRLLKASVEVLNHMAVGRMDTIIGQELRDELQYELMRTSLIVGQTVRDLDKAAQWRDVERITTMLGYDTFWLSWTDTQDNRQRARRAADRLVQMLADVIQVKAQGKDVSHFVCMGVCDATSHLAQRNVCAHLSFAPHHDVVE